MTSVTPAIRDVPEAIRLAENACQLSNYREGDILDTLSMAYAAAGRFSEAKDTGQKALNIALSRDNYHLAEKIRKQIKLYEGLQSGGK